MSSPGPGKGKKKRKNKGRGSAGRGRGRGQDLPPTPGRPEGAGNLVDDEEVVDEREERPATGATSVPEPSSSTAAEYDDPPEIGREKPREYETTANENEKVQVAEDGKTPSCSTAVPQPQGKSKGKQQKASGTSKSSVSSPSSGTKVKGKLY